MKKAHAQQLYNTLFDSKFKKSMGTRNFTLAVLETPSYSRQSYVGNWIGGFVVQPRILTNNSSNGALNLEIMRWRDTKNEYYIVFKKIKYTW